MTVKYQGGFLPNKQINRTPSKENNSSNIYTS